MIPSYSLIDAVRDIWALWLADTEMRWDVREICAEPWLVKMEGEWLVCSITSHISLVQTESEKREIISTSVILRSGGPEILRQNESFSFSNSFTNRGRQISGLMFERLSSGQLCCFHDSGDSGLCNAADYQIPGETRPPNIWHETRKLNRGEILQPR